MTMLILQLCSSLIIPCPWSSDIRRSARSATANLDLDAGRLFSLIKKRSCRNLTFENFCWTNTISRWRQHLHQTPVIESRKLLLGRLAVLEVTRAAQILSLSTISKPAHHILLPTTQTISKSTSLRINQAGNNYRNCNLSLYFLRSSQRSEVRQGLWPRWKEGALLFP